MYKILVQERQAFSVSDDDIGCAKDIEVEIKTKDDIPIQRTPYRLDVQKAEALEQEIEKLRRLGVIRPSFSAYSAPVVFLPKKDKNSWRICIDYRALNSMLEDTVYPMTNLKDITDKLAYKRYYTTMDCNHGYYNFKLKESDQKKTAFSTRSGHYMWTRLPQGIKPGPNVFQRYMSQKVLEGMSVEEVNVYLDDIIMYSNTFGEHLKVIQTVLSKIKASGMKLKPRNCFF